MSTKRTSSLTSRAIPILAYHDFNASSWKYSLDPLLFDEHLGYLQSKEYVLLNLRDYSQSAGLALSTKSLILTFNGAFKRIETILPILQKYKAKATIFVPSAHVGKKATWMNSQDNTLTLLDWEDLRSLSLMGFEIASHGHEHLQLDIAPAVLARHDISYSKILLEDHLGKPCLSFAYPYGYYNTQVRDLVRTTGFSLACTLDERVSTSESDPFALPRFTMTQDLNIARLKHLLKPKDSRYSPYSSVKTNLSRQLRRWKIPLTREPLITYEEVSSTSIKDAELSPTASVTELKKNSESIGSVSVTADSQLPSNPEVLPHNEALLIKRYDQWQRSTKEESMEEDIRPTEEVRQIEYQGEYLASCKAALRDHPYDTLREYQQLFQATEQLQTAQERQTRYAHFEKVESSYEAFTIAVQHHLETQLGIQKDLLQKHLVALNVLNNTPIQSSVERVKTLLGSYMTRLERGPLQEVEIRSTETLIQNLQQRLRSTYHRQLMQLVHQATKHNAFEVLKDIQQATRLLEQDHYPNLDKLKQSLAANIAQDKQAQQRQRKSEQFKRKLQELQTHFAPLSHLNNEKVYTLAGILEHLESQKLSFHKVSDTMQQELMHLLKEARYILSQLQKEQQATMKIAEHILTSGNLTDLFSSLHDGPVMPQSLEQIEKQLRDLN